MPMATGFTPAGDPHAGSRILHAGAPLAEARGAAILVRIPLQIHRGDPSSRCTTAIVPWTRTTRLHLVSVYESIGPAPTTSQATIKRRTIFSFTWREWAMFQG